jgi:hypothetical protein
MIGGWRFSDLGYKGILFFSLDSKKVRFLRWDAIKQIETL